MIELLTISYIISSFKIYPGCTNEGYDKLVKYFVTLYYVLFFIDHCDHRLRFTDIEAKIAIKKIGVKQKKTINENADKNKGTTSTHFYNKLKFNIFRHIKTQFNLKFKI